MINQLYTGTSTSRRFVTLPNVSAFTVAGIPILVGTEPAVTLDAYQSNVGGATCLFNGTFKLTVIGETAASPQVTAAVNPGDKLYASGTLDSTTNVTYNLTIDKNSGNTLFGHLDPSETKILAGVTNTAAGVVIDAI